MKKVIVLAGLMALLVSCKDEKESDSKTLAYNDIGKESHKELYGIWTGYMEPVFPEGDNAEEYYIEDTDEMTDEPKMVSIKINRITNDSVYGMSISGGNQRPLRGTFSATALATTMMLAEPGNDKYDGRFELEFINDSLSGKWITYKKNKGLTPIKTLKLAKKQFKYNPLAMLKADTQLVDWSSPKKQEVPVEDFDGEEDEDSGDSTAVAVDSIQVADAPEMFIDNVYRTASDAVFKLNASTMYLVEEDLKNLTKLDMEIIRNTIFARHGFSFKRTSLRSFFEAADWYVPVANNVDKDLTKLEKTNIALLKRMEQYADDHYEHFGR